jgi:GntR family transcriptional regulator/MocR family aminotransferase
VPDRRFPLDAIVLDRSSDDPLRRQLYKCLKAMIQQNLLPGNWVLPSTRELAADLNLGRNTVVAAYDQLITEGYLRNRPGARPTIVDFPAPRARPSHHANALARLSRRGHVMSTQPFHYGQPGQIAFHPGLPDAANFPFALFSRLLAKRAKFARSDLFGTYNTAGHPELRAAIATYLKAARGVKCSADQIIVTTGAQASLDLLARLILDPGDCVWMEDPGYYGAYSAFAAAGGVLRPLSVDGDGWHIESEPKERPRLIYITPSCQHPLGMTMHVEKRLRLLEAAQRWGAFIIEDDFDGEYRFVGQPVPSLQGYDQFGHVIYVGTFAKILFPALRLGFMVVSPAQASKVARALSITGQFAPLLLQAALADFIEQGHMAQHLRRMRRIYSQRRRLFFECCESELGKDIRLLQSDAGIQVAGVLTTPGDDSAICKEAWRLGVNASPLSMQYRHGAPIQGLLLGYAACDEPTTRKGLRLLKIALQNARLRPFIGHR